MENEPENSATKAFTVLGIVFDGALLRTGIFHQKSCNVRSDMLQSLALGRPPSIRLSYVDTEFPDDDEATVDEQGNTLVGCEVELSFCVLQSQTDLSPDYRWKYEFAKDVFASVIELTLTAEAPSYQTILDLDKRVREKTFFPHLNAFINPEDDQSTPSVYMKQSLLGQYRSIGKSHHASHGKCQAPLKRLLSFVVFAPKFLCSRNA